MAMCRLLIVAALLLQAVGVVRAFRPAAFEQSGLGRPPTAAEIKAMDIDVLPDGRGLPPGSGTAERGRDLYARQCAACHGASGKEGPSDILVGGNGSLATARPLKTVGSFWPYATTLFDYTSRAMPFQRPGTLTADETYGLVAYLLFLNGIVPEDAVMDAASLPKVVMPARDRFVPDNRTGGKTVK